MYICSLPSSECQQIIIFSFFLYLFTKKHSSFELGIFLRLLHIELTSLNEFWEYKRSWFGTWFENGSFLRLTLAKVNTKNIEN